MSGPDASSVDGILDHPDVQRLLASLAQRPGKPLERPDPFRWAAVAVVIRANEAGAPEMLMIKRAEHEGDPWSGHVAFPGGRRDPGDRDLAHTAIRETWEETAIDLERDGRLLGAMNDLTPLTPLLPPVVIRPFVAVVSTGVTIVPSREVAFAFWVPLASLLEEASWGMAMVEVRALGMREHSVFTHGEHTVWGLTERVLQELAERLRP